MYFNDHEPSHFHAEYGEFEALIEIETLAILRVDCPGEPWHWSSNGPLFTVKRYEPTGIARAWGPDRNPSRRLNRNRHETRTHP